MHACTRRAFVPLTPIVFVTFAPHQSGHSLTRRAERANKVPRPPATILAPCGGLRASPLCEMRAFVLSAR